MTKLRETKFQISSHHYAVLAPKHKKNHRKKTEYFTFRGKIIRNYYFLYAHPSVCTMES